VRDETLRCQFGSFQIATADADSPYADLTHDAERHG
jgi:hypothetical protein